MNLIDLSNLYNFIFFSHFNFLESSPNKCNGIIKSNDDEDDAPLLKKSFEPSKSITKNTECFRRPRVYFK